MSHTVELRSVGTELLLGNIVNSDARDLSRELSALGPEQAVDFACVCVQLSQTARAIGETQALKWWGVL